MREIEKLHVTTYEWKYSNILKCCNFFSSEFEEMKSWIYRVETVNAGMGLHWFWHRLFIMLLEQTVLFTTKGLQNTKCDESLQYLSNAHPACCWVAYF